MRLLTPEQQAAVPLGQEIGSLAVQGLPQESSGGRYVTGDIQSFTDTADIPTWRHAIALKCVHKSRYGEWTPFRKADGGEVWHACQYGIAWATDGVHILIRGVEGRWLSRSAQVVEFVVQRPYGGKTKVNAAKHLKISSPTNKTTKADTLMSEYLSL